jgi:hypothetical protein
VPRLDAKMMRESALRSSPGSAEEVVVVTLPRSLTEDVLWRGARRAARLSYTCRSYDQLEPCATRRCRGPTAFTSRVS